jgi:hypothetical protein
MKLHEFRRLEPGEIVVRKGEGDKFPVEWRVMSVDLSLEQVHITTIVKRPALFAWVSVNPYDCDTEFIEGCRRQGQ